MGFIDTLRSEGHAVESICRVVREQGCQVQGHDGAVCQVSPPTSNS
jgi:hypothetical protein